MIDLTQKILMLDGTDIPQSTEKEAPPLTLKYVLTNSLLAESSEGPKLTGPERIEREGMARVIHESREQLFSAAEVVLLKECVLRIYKSSLIFGQVVRMIEPAVTAYQRPAIEGTKPE